MTGIKSRHTQARLAARIREAQAASGKTNEAMANEIGVTPRVFQKWRSGQITPRYSNLSKFAEASKTPLAWFFAEEDTKSV